MPAYRYMRVLARAHTTLSVRSSAYPQQQRACRAVVTAAQQQWPCRHVVVGISRTTVKRVAKADNGNSSAILKSECFSDTKTRSIIREMAQNSRERYREGSTYRVRYRQRQHAGAAVAATGWAQHVLRRACSGGAELCARGSVQKCVFFFFFFFFFFFVKIIIDSFRQYHFFIDYRHIYLIGLIRHTSCWSYLENMNRHRDRY